MPRHEVKSISEAYNIVEYILQIKLHQTKIHNVFDRFKFTYQSLIKIQIRLKN